MRSDELTTIGDHDLLGGLTRLGAVRLDLLDNVHTFDDLAEDDVLLVEPGGLGGGDEELGSVGVGSGVGHGHDSGSGVLQLEVFVFELVSVDGLATGTVVVGEVTSLAHEVGDHTVEGRVLVTEAFLSGAQSTEIFSSLGHDI